MIEFNANRPSLRLSFHRKKVNTSNFVTLLSNYRNLSIYSLLMTRVSQRASEWGFGWATKNVFLSLSLFYMCWDPTVIFLHLAPASRMWMDECRRRFYEWGKEREKKDTENCLTNNNFRDRPVSKLIIKNKTSFSCCYALLYDDDDDDESFAINLNVKHATTWSSWDEWMISSFFSTHSGTRMICDQDFLIDMASSWRRRQASCKLMIITVLNDDKKSDEYGRCLSSLKQQQKKQAMT